jgi:succinate dehydrogenase/fumarate reductase iron-sulfur protein
MPDSPEMLVASIFRYDPAVDSAPRYDRIEVPASPHMRVLDVLDYAVDQCGLGVGYRYFCGVKRCGMCGISVDGKSTLACWEEARDGMVIDPLPKMPVIRDLAVDRSAFEAAMVDLHPQIVREQPYAGFPEPVTHVDMSDAYKLMNCIECHVCTSSCPAVPDAGPLDFAGRDFIGPANVVQIAKAALHPRDEMDRSAQLEAAGLENCMSCGRCEEVCPNGIPIVTGAILPLRAIAARGPRGMAAMPRHFADNVREHADVHSAALFVRTRGVGALLRSLPMVLRMVLHRKSRLWARADGKALRGIRAVFAVADKGAES